MITKDTTSTVNFYVTDIDGLPVTGKASSITATISVNGDTASAISDTISEIDSTNLPGWYRFNHFFSTAGNVFIVFSCSGCVITPWEDNVINIAASSVPTAAENAAAVWGYSSGRTITNTIPSASDIATAIWIADLDSYSYITTPGMAYKYIKGDSSVLGSIALDVADIPAAVWGYRSGRTITNTIPSVNDIWGRTGQDTTSRTLTAATLSSGSLSTFNASNDTVTIDATQAARMATATGFATPNDISTAQSAIISAMPVIPNDYAKPGDNMNLLADALINIKLGLASSAEVTGAKNAIINAMPVIPSDYAKASDIPTASANATAVWTYSTRLLTSPLIDKPVEPPEVAVEIMTTSNSYSISDAIKRYGDLHWKTAVIPSDYAKTSDLSGLSTFDAATDTVLIDATQAATMTTATGFATAADVSGAVSALETYGDNHWTGGSGGATAQQIWEYPTRTITASPTDVSSLATKTDLSNTQTAILGAMPSTSGLATATNISDAQTAIINALPTIPSDYAKAGDTMALSTTDINSIKSGLATSINVSDAQAAVIAAIPSVPSDYAKPGDAMTLTSAYNAAKTASQLTAADIPTSDIAAIKAKTDNLPASPAATGTEMSLTNATITAIQNGLATSANISALQTHGDSYWGISPEGEITVVVDADEIAEAVWNNDERTLTDDISTITAQDVWEYGSRTLTQYGPDISPDEPVGAVYCTPSDVERRWGINNVRQWADLENDGDNAKIQTQIDWAILAASERINSDLAASIYLLPFNPVPYAVRRFAATLAGVELYNTRAVNISRDQSNAEIRTALADYSNWITSVLSNVPIVGATLK